MTSFWNRIAASDPGFLRLQSSFRGLIAGLISANLFYAISIYTHLPLAHFFPGIYFAVLSSVFTNDADLRSQKLTLLASLLFSVLIFTMGSLLSTYVLLMSLTFSTIIFVATYIRKFGPRWNTIGAISFTLFFLAAYSQTPFRQLPLALATLAVGGAISYAVRFWFVPSHSVRTLQRMIDAYRVQLLTALNRSVAVHGQYAESQSREKLDTDLSDLNEAALSLDENFGRVGCSKNSEASKAVQRGREIIFEIETRVELTARATFERVMNSETPLEQIRELANNQEPFVHKAVDALGELLDLLLKDGASMPLPLQGQAPQQNPKNAFRLACQAGIASLIATVAGRLISAPHWYWTVISAYVVFVRTKSFADTNVRAWQRVVGTLIGAALGLLIAEEAQMKYLGLGIMALAIFIAYYFIKPAYMVMVVFMTIFLAELYEVTGQFSFNVLALRVGLTLVGALIGVATARIVFPLKPSIQIEDTLADSLKSLASVKEMLSQPRLDEDKLPEFRDRLLEAVRDFDRNLRITRATALASHNHDLKKKVTAMFEEGVKTRAITANQLRSFGSDVL